MDPTKVDTVKIWPEPTSVKFLQFFLGFCHYYNRFIKDYSKTIALLMKLLQKHIKFVQGESQQKAFDELRLALISSLILRMPCFDKLFTVHVDASDVAIGAV